MTTELVRKENVNIEMDKRQHAPYVLHYKCPKCHYHCAIDYNCEYLSYPTTGRPEKLTLYCGECEHEWPGGTLTIDITLTHTPPDDRQGA